MAKELSADEIKNLKKNAIGILTNVRYHLVCDFPFIGNVAMKLNIVPIRDIRCRTASTDGKNIYFDIEWLSELSNDQRMFVFAHEVWHNVLLHFVRKQSRDAQLFNVAGDFEVNQLLKKDNMVSPPDLCWPSKYGLPEGKSAEEYYEMLLKQTKNNSSSNNRSKSSNSSKSANDQNGSGGNGKPSNKSASNSKLSGQFDKHEYADSNGGGGGGGGSGSKEGYTDKYGSIGFDEDYNPSISEDAAEKMREAAISAAQMVERSKGSLPGHITAIIEKLKKPEIRWQEVLAQFVTRCIGEKRQWCPPNRRHVWHDTYLQSRRGQKIKIAVGIDTSGSTQGDIPKFLGELNSLVNSFGNYEIHLIQCDTEVEDYQMYSNDNPLDLEGTSFMMSGGGGTELHPIFKYVDEKQLDIDAYVIFTDGFIEKFPIEDDPGKPTMWILTADGNENEIEFGEIVKFKESSWE